MGNVPLDTSQNGSHIVCWAPSVLENVKAQLACTVHVGVEHLADELDSRRLVWILLLEVHHKAERSIFEGSIGRADDDGIPRVPSVNCNTFNGAFSHTRS